MSDRERAVCSRVRSIREQIKWSQIDFARELGITRPRLASIEYGHTPLRYELAAKLCRTFDVNPKWLATGEGDPRPHSPLLRTAEQRSKCGPNPLFTEVFDLFPIIFEPFGRSRAIRPDEILDDFDLQSALALLVKSKCSRLRFIDRFPAWKFVADIGAMIKKRIRKDIARGLAVQSDNPIADTAGTSGVLKILDLTKTATAFNVATVEGYWPLLKRRLKKATEDIGGRSKLAAFVGVDLTRISQWLSDSESAREPGAEYALRMLTWVELQATQQNKSPGRALTRPERKTRKRQSSYEKPKSSPP